MLKIIKSLGLSNQEVAQALKRFGYNELPKSKNRQIFTILAEILLDPMFVLLILGGVLYFILGDKQEALMLLGFVFLVVVVSLVQQNKTERALDRLKDLSAPKAVVIRNGEQSKISGREVVPGDLVVISEGDRIPADAYVIENYGLMVNESLLTGESVAVSKIVHDGKEEKFVPGGDELPVIFSGTMAIRGRALVTVYATGINTEIGKIGKSLEGIQQEDSDLKKQTIEVVKIYASIGVALCIIIIFIFGLIQGNWLRGILAGITLAMSILPEEFPVILTIFLAMGAWRMSQKKVLARKTSAIEFLGKTTVLCSDKTGTITQNKMAVTHVFDGDKIILVKEKNQTELFNLAEIAYYSTPYESVDPMDKAISGFGYQYDNEELSLVREYEFDHDLLAMSRVFERGVNKYLIAAKGAPEAIMDLCHLSDKKMAELRLEIDKMANKGLRIIGLAKSEFSKKKAATSQHDYDFKFVGFLGLSDPIRPEIPESIKVCYEAGIRVIMITGDYPLTAINIAQQIGLNNYQQVISGQELEKLSDSELSEKVKVTNIFARIIPAQKLRIVNALKSNGEVVAMTGDGVNDAPALKAADIGVSMGERGTDVAREASSLVLMDDNFSSIVAAVKMGRRIYENIRKAITYVFSIHIPIAIMSFIPPIFGMPLVLLPMHIVFMEMLIDPSCSIVFEMEKEEADIMKRKPRSGKEKLFNKKMILTGSFQGLSVLILVLLIYVIAVYKGLDDNTVRTIAFITLTVGNVGLVFTNRSDKNIFVTANRSVNKAFISVSVFATIFLLLTVYVPYLRDIFQFAILPWYLWAWPVVFGLVGVFLAEWFRLQIIKHFSRVDAL